MRATRLPRYRSLAAGISHLHMCDRDRGHWSLEIRTAASLPSRQTCPTGTRRSAACPPRPHGEQREHVCGEAARPLHDSRARLGCVHLPRPDASNDSPAAAGDVVSRLSGVVGNSAVGGGMPRVALARRGSVPTSRATTGRWLPCRCASGWRARTCREMPDGAATMQIMHGMMPCKCTQHAWHDAMHMHNFDLQMHPTCYAC